MKYNVISDTTPLIALSNIGKIDLLKDIFGNIIIPKGVWEEVVEEGKGRPGSEIKDFKWVKVKNVKNKEALKSISDRFGKGEREVIILTLEMKNPLIIIDEKPAKAKLVSLKIPVIGTIGLLLIAKRKGLIPNIKEMMDKLIETGFYIDKGFYNNVLKYANETI